jgi:DNA-binding transcriptional ArsR family regulator
MMAGNIVFPDYTSHCRRLDILRILRGLPERRTNQLSLRMSLRSFGGYEELVSTITNDLSFLRKQGLVLLEELPGDVVMATLTDLGDQAARGVTRIAGVAAPAVE